MISTPCIKLCVIEPETQICIGCGRTANEIGGWLSFSETQRLDLMQILPERLKTLTARGTRRQRPSDRRRDERRRNHSTP